MAVDTTMLQDCVDELVTRLESLVLTNQEDGEGARTITGVITDPEGIDDQGLSFPYILVDAVSQADTGGYLNVAQIRRVQQVHVRLRDARVQTATWSKSKLASALLADLWRGIACATGTDTLEITLGGNAIIVTWATGRMAASTAKEAFIEVECLINIEYRHAANDPRKIV